MCAYRPNTPEETEAFKQALCDQWGDEFDIIIGSTRAGLIADGVLVDLADPPFDALLQIAGVVFHAAMTDTCFRTCFGDTFDARDAGHVKRFWKFLSTFKAAIKATPADDDRVFFDLIDPDGKPVNCYAVVGPGDRGEPVITVMLVGED